MKNDVINDGTFLCSMIIFSADNDSVIPVVNEAVKTPQTEIPIVIQTIPNSLAFSDFGVLSPYLKRKFMPYYLTKQLSCVILVRILVIKELQRQFNAQMKQNGCYNTEFHKKRSNC